MKKYRILEKTPHNGIVYYEIQRRWLFWWVTVKEQYLGFFIERRFNTLDDCNKFIEFDSYKIKTKVL